MNENRRLPQAFLRSLEADLRALCADARRRNPDLKEAAERVILSLKEAENVESELEAADNAASAFSAACETVDPTVSSATASLQNKISLRAVSCLHKLLTHRALSTSRLKEVLDAFQRLGSNCIDDNVTLKVLQGLLSLLTVRTYAKSLTEDELSRAFSLLFILKTSHSANAGLSAISPMPTHHDSGVIEQTAKAAFRQVSSDLFASAADSAVCTAVEKQIPSGGFIALAEFPSEVQATHSLFMDLCNATQGEKVSWLSKLKPGGRTGEIQLELSLALEVIDDCLSHNIGLFAVQPVFSEILSARLCPTLHRLLKTTSDKTTVKSLFALVVTIIRNYWRDLKPDVEIFLSTLANMSSSAKPGQSGVGWNSIFASEALRCTFTLEPGDTPTLMYLAKDFDLSGSSSSCISNVISAAIVGMNGIESIVNLQIPPNPVTGRMKPFANNIKNTMEYYTAISVGLYLNILLGIEGSLLRSEEEVSKFLLSASKTEKAIALLGKIASFDHILATTGQTASEELQVEAVRHISKSIGRISIMSNDCKLESIRDQSIAILADSCKSAVSVPKTSFTAKPSIRKDLFTLYTVLFDVVDKCKESLKRSWLPVLDAFDKLNELLSVTKLAAESDGTQLSDEVKQLENNLEGTFESSSELTWSARHDLLSGLIQCSRQTITNASKNVIAEDSTSGDKGSEVQIFGMRMTEKVLLLAFQISKNDSDETLSELWQLAASHYVSVCTDSSIPKLRKLSLESLTRVACGAIAKKDASGIKHDKIISPFVDLLSSTYADARSGSLSSVYQILESHGELLKGESAWLAVMSILSTSVETVAGTVAIIASEGKEDESGQKATSSGQSQIAGLETITTGFKVVQVIADDFLSSLDEQSLSSWIHVLGRYSCQKEDVNVAFTSIDFLWRTADLIGKTPVLSKQHDLWIVLFSILKHVSMDSRPEIRNCAVKTLTGALSAHSSHLSASAWIGCAQKALLPLLEDVMQAGARMTERGEKPSTGKGPGDVQLRVHYSRDTPRKQWNETRVLALAGVARVLRIAMPKLSILHDEDGNPLFLMLTTGGAESPWRKILRAAGIASSSRDGEVAVAGVSALLELLNAAGFVVNDQEKEFQVSQTTIDSYSSVETSLSMVDPNDSTPNIWPTGEIHEKNVEKAAALRSGRKDAITLWEAVWSALAEVLREEPRETTEKSSGSEGKIVDQRALKILAEGLIEARESFPKKFTSGSSKILVDVFKHLVTKSIPGQTESNAKSMADDLTDVQEVTLNGMKHLSFGDDDEGWYGLIDSLLCMIDESKLPTKPSRKLTRRVFEIVLYLYNESKMSHEMKRKKLPDVLSILGRIMLEKSQEEENGVIESRPSMQNESIPLWEESVKVIVNIMRRGNEKSKTIRDEKVWKEFIKHVEAFIHMNEKRGNEYTMNDENERKKREMYCIELSDCVKNGLIELSNEKASETRNRLLRVLSKGAEEGSCGWRPRFVRNCQSSLFSLSDGDDDVAELVKNECEEYVIGMCNEILGKFVWDGQRAGKCPLPAKRRAEAMFLMLELRRMHRNGSSLVMTLHARLCECVESKDEAIRSLARELLDEAAPKASKQSKDDMEIRNTLTMQLSTTTYK